MRTPRLSGRVGVPTAARRPARLRGVLDPRGRRLPRGRSLDRAAVAGRLPRPRGRRPRRQAGLGAAQQAHLDPGEDRPALADREPDAPRLRDRTLDRGPTGAVDPGGVRRRAQSEVSQHLAAGPRLHPAEARSASPRERDPKAIAAWLESDWPRIKKKPGGRAPTSP